MGYEIKTGQAYGTGQGVEGLEPYTGIVYHYTNVDGALGILSNGVVWASAASVLNDTSELGYGIKRVRDLHTDWQPPHRHDVGGVTALHRAVIQLDRDVALDRTFIVSASTTEESLNQWAHYANGSGYALGFRGSEALFPERTTAIPHEPSADDEGKRLIGTLGVWRRVAYEPERQDAIIASAFDHIARLPADRGRAPRILANVVSLMKHPTFAVEDEVRMVIWQDDNTRVRFRAQGTRIVPYVQLAGMNPPTGGSSGTWHPSFYSGDTKHAPDATELPLTAALTGPPAGDDAVLRTATLESLVRSMGYDASVSHVPIPLR
jgi:hypothetical protein